MKRELCIILALMLLMAMVPSTAFAAGSKKVYVSSTGKGTLNLRAGPGYSYAVLGYVHHNNKVKTFETSGDWTKVKYGKKIGWIKTMYIDGTTKELGKGYKAIDSATQVYAKADTGSSVVGSLTTSDTVKVYYTENDMASVRVTGSSLSGWIPISVIGATVTLKADTPPSSAKTAYRTTASTLNVRKGPGTSTIILGSLKKGSKVTVKSVTGNWAYVKAKKLTGYVSMNYLRF